MKDFYQIVPLLMHVLGFNSAQVDRARRELKKIQETPHG